MIIGMGNDLCNIERIERSIARFGDRFKQRCFTETEIALAERRRRSAETYAKRFAAKEACAKALGTGVPRRGVHWTGKPTMKLIGGAEKRLAEIMPPGHEALIHLTITDDHPWASAVVIIEAVPQIASS
jgi:holo-[acyl-carrier protein] synthase